MYETIMDLPLFKGLGADQISLMLEKTRVEFLNFEDGEIVAQPDTHVRAVDFIISGQINKINNFENFDVSIVETLGKGAVIGALNMYGLFTNYLATYVAKGKTSIMRICKEPYMNILLSDKIYILNYLNYLSAAVHRNIDKTLNVAKFSIQDYLSILTSSLVSPLAESVEIKGSDQELAKLCGVSVDEIISWKNKILQDSTVQAPSNTIRIK